MVRRTKSRSKSPSKRSPLRTHLKPSKRRFHHPLMEAYLKNQKTRDPVLVEKIAHQYSLSILDRPALNYLKRYSPMIEIGAGNGYNAYLLQQLGVNLIAYDKHYHSQMKYWTKVNLGTDRHVKYYPNNNLIISWPPPNNEMAYNSIKNFKEGSKANYFIYLGEYRNKKGAINEYSTGTPKFFDYLEKHYDLVVEKQLPNWIMTETKLYVFKKK